MKWNHHYVRIQWEANKISSEANRAARGNSRGGHLNHFLPRNKRHKGVIMDVEILSPQTHIILNRRLEFRKLPLLNFSIFQFFSPTLFKLPEIILSRRNYTIKINNTFRLADPSTSTKIGIQKHWLDLLIYNLKRSRTGIKATSRNPYIHQRISLKSILFPKKSHQIIFHPWFTTTGFINLDWSYAEIHRFLF